MRKTLSTVGRGVLIGAMGAAGLWPAISIGQELEEVLVTATRRGESDILSTPVAITAITGEQAERFAPRDLNGVAVSVPGLSAGNVAAFRSAQFALRGVSETTIIVYKESPVGVTLDDFVMPHIQTSNLEMFDIEQVEVLRGPQGTLFGKNTTGGVINVRTKRPDLQEAGADVRFRFGDFGTRQAQVAVDFPIIEDQLAFRFAGQYLKSDGFYKNNAAYGPLGAIVPVDPTFAGLVAQGDGRDLGGDDVFSGRAKLLWEPNDRLSALFQYEIIRDDGDTPPIVNESPDGYLFPLWGYPAATGDPIDSAGVTFRDDLLQNMSAGHRVDVDGIYLNLDYELNDQFTLYANAGRREQESRLPSTYTGHIGPVSLFDATRDDNRETSQVEVRVGSELNGPFNFTTGLYYQKDDTDFCVLQVVGFLDNFFLGTPPAFFNNNPLILCNRQRANAKALYFDGTYDINDRLHLTAGVRYTIEEKAWAGRPRVNTFLLDGSPTLEQLGEPLAAADFDRFPTGVVFDDEDWEEPTYRINLGYDFTDDMFGYVNYSRGFKSGGYNDQIGTQLNPITPLAARPTDPEIADSFEFGLKGRFAQGAGTYDVTAFFADYSDAQRTLNATFPTGQETLFFNAAELEVKGIEFSGSWAATDNLTFRANGSYLDAEFKTFEADTNFDGVIDIDLSGRPVTRAPETQLTVEGQYLQDLASGGNLAYNLRVAYEDDSVASYSDLGDEFNTTLNSKTLVDANVTYTSADDNWWISLIGTNLTDERYRVGSLSVATLWVMSAYGPPRWYGVEFGVRF